jgi:anti-sigma regulatory factor (Ser/Thr protein kinase)
VLLLVAAAETRSASVACSALTRFAASAGAPARVQSAVAHAVTEACANVVLRARGDAAGPGTIEVRASHIGGRLLIEVRDRGPGVTARMSFRVP